MQQASRWGKHDRGKPYHYDTTGDGGKSGRPSSEHDRGEKGEHDRGKPYCMDYPHHDLMVHATS